MRRAPRYDPYARPPAAQQPPPPAAAAAYAQPAGAGGSFSTFQQPAPSFYGGSHEPSKGFVGGGGFARGGPREREWERDRSRGRESGARDGGLPSAAEQGAPQEQQSRTLFVRNVSYNTSERTLIGLFEKYGEIKRVFNLIDKRGMAFITYYDIRDAEEAKRDLQGYDFEGRPLDIHYSIPRDDEDQAKNEEENNSTVFARLRGGKGPLRDKPPMTNREVKRLFEEWGSVKEVRDCKGKPFQKFVEFYDVRHSERCLKEAADTHKSTILDVQPAHAKRDRRDEDRDRDRHRPSSWSGGDYDRGRRADDDYHSGGPARGTLPYTGGDAHGRYGPTSTLPNSAYLSQPPQQVPYAPSSGSVAAAPLPGLPQQQQQGFGSGAAGGDVGATLQTLLSLVQLFNQPQPPQQAPGYSLQYPTQTPPAQLYTPQHQQQPGGVAATISYPYHPQPTNPQHGYGNAFPQTSSGGAQAPPAQLYPPQPQQQQQQRYGGT